MLIVPLLPLPPLIPLHPEEKLRLIYQTQRWNRPSPLYPNPNISIWLCNSSHHLRVEQINVKLLYREPLYLHVFVCSHRGPSNKKAAPHTNTHTYKSKNDTRQWDTNIMCSSFGSLAFFFFFPFQIKLCKAWVKRPNHNHLADLYISPLWLLRRKGRN